MGPELLWVHNTEQDAERCQMQAQVREREKRGGEETGPGSILRSKI